MESRPQSMSLAWFLLVAILLHLILPRIPIPELPQFVKSKKEDDRSKEIVVETMPGADKKPVVQTSKARESEKAKDKEARYAGEFKNRVEQETQAHRRGNFQEGFVSGHRGDGKDGTQSNSGSGEATAKRDLSEDGEEEQRAGGSGPGMSDLMAFSATPNELSKDIPDGGQTVLNTDTVVYASFLNRIADQIYQPWVSHARQAVEGLYLEGHKLAANTYVTKLGVSMNAKGGVAAIKIIQSCGIAELDEAPKRAFWEREPFPNPPIQMFGKEALVTFPYEFHFEWKTSSFSIVPGAI